MVTIIFPSLISKLIHEKQTEVQARTLGEALNKLIEKYGESFKQLIFDETGKIHRFLFFYVYGKRINSFDISKEVLKEDDRINILIIITGG